MKIGIDLGTANVLVYVKGRGVVIQEPSVVAVSDDNHIIAVGEEAREMIGRTPGNITAIRPMKDGVIADYVITEAMLRYFIRKAGRWMTKPDVMISVPSGVTSVEKRAVRGAGLKGGRPGVRRNRSDDAIANYIRKKYNLMVGERPAEDVKIQIGAALPLERELQMEVRGRDLIAGLPRTISLTSSEVTEALEEPLHQIGAAGRPGLG